MNGIKKSKIIWKSLLTGETGHSKPMSASSVQALVEKANQKYTGQLVHLCVHPNTTYKNAGKMLDRIG